ncbi:hypothetical protein J1N35_013933 [Gossypium stocksii]|uniref:Aminotransferase-like plant mobile domain-containing protein n=1 Tax=Gossypium stocksii TaxID=47602 RepID=A0A9D4A9G0_9ROSI|nr:hypothetical protein J1N35_013933 [Gossypium stocksii]
MDHVGAGCQPGVYHMLKACVHCPGYHPDKLIMPYLEAIRFGIAVLVRMVDFRSGLKSALVKWSHSKTHTFHLLCKECTITLEDVAIQLELSVDSDAIMSRRNWTNFWAFTTIF